MKKYSVQLAILVIIAMVSNSVYGMGYKSDRLSIHNFEPMDFYIVNQIHKKTDITLHDVQKWKFLFIGRQGYTALQSGLGILAGYQSTKYPNLLSKGVGFLPENYQPSGVLGSLLQNNIVWATVAAGSAAAGLYPILYGRIYDGLKEKVYAFLEFCQTDAKNIVETAYSSYTALREGISHPSYQRGDKQKPVLIPKSAFPLPTYLALKDLQDQGICASQIITNLWNAAGEQDRSELSIFAASVDAFIANCTHNKNLVIHSQEFKNEIENRKHAAFEQHSSLTKEADLTLRQNKAWGSYVDNANKVFKFVQGVTAYMVKYKAELAALATGVYIQRKFSGN